MANLKGLKLGSKITHCGNCEENFHKVYEATIVEFNGLAIMVKSASGTVYSIQTWDII